MKIHDITVPISANMVVYPGDPVPEAESISLISEGESANVTKLSFGVHSGTHVDAPNHFIDGTLRVHELELEKLIGPCVVVEIADDITAIEPKHIGDIGGVDRLLLKTRNSAFWDKPDAGFSEDLAFITLSTAEMLVQNRIKLVGIDQLSIEQFGVAEHSVHNILLQNEIVILEAIDLRNVRPGVYDLACLPLKYIGGSGDGSPARTVLIER